MVDLERALDTAVQAAKEAGSSILRGTLTCIAAVPGIFAEVKAYAETQYSRHSPR